MPLTTALTPAIPMYAIPAIEDDTVQLFRDVGDNSSACPSTDFVFCAFFSFCACSFCSFSCTLMPTRVRVDMDLSRPLLPRRSVEG